MAAQWIDLRGARFYGISDADNLEPTEFPNALHGPLTMGPFAPLGNVGRTVIAEGNPAVIDAHRTKIVRAVEITAEVTLSLYSRNELVVGLGEVTQLLTTLQRVDVVSAHLGQLAMGRPRERISNVVRRNASDVPPATETAGWTWTAPQRRLTPEPPIVDLEAGVSVPRAEHWTQRGTVPFAFQDTTLPMNFIGTSDLTVDSFAGAYVFFPPQFKNHVGTGWTERAATMDAAFPRLRLLVDDRPNWRVSAPARVGTGLLASVPIEVTLSYPSGEPVVGETIRVSTAGARVELASSGSSRFRAWAESMSDGQGKVRFQVRGVEEGAAVVEIINGRTDLDGGQQGVFGQLYSPPLFGSVTVRVYGGQESGLPDEEPQFPPPPYDPDAPPQPEEPPVVTPGETTCTTYPAVDAIPHVPARTETKIVNAWDAGANSVDELDGDVRTVFSFDSKVVGVAVGFVDHRDDVQDYARLAIGVLMSQSASGVPQFRVMEYGRFRTEFIEYWLGEEIEIRRVQGEFSVWYEDWCVFRSTQFHDSPLIVGSSLYSTGDTL